MNPFKRKKLQRKWLLPATCGMCKRTCTEFWGECADAWACEGHYHIMQTNSDTWGFKHYKEYQVASEALDKLPKPLSDEDRADFRASTEFKDWYEGPIHTKWIERRKRGIQWLKDNPEPESAPACSFCEEEARAHDKEEFYCMEHWPLKDFE